MVLLHGSGGVQAGREMRIGQWLADHGIAAFVIDYYLPRGVGDETNYMLRVIAVTEFDAVADAYGALQLLSTHPAIDASRVGVMGFSYGGMAVRIAMDERVRSAFAPELSGFSAFVDVYGPCFQDLGTKATNGAPLLTLRGTEDASNELEACVRREDELRGLGVAVETHVYACAGLPRARLGPSLVALGGRWADGEPRVTPPQGRTRLSDPARAIDSPVRTG